MKKLSLLCFASLFASLNAFAGTCNNGSLLSVYSYEFDGVGTNLGTWAAVGRIKFNGTGNVTFSGVETSNGVAADVTGSGTYSVNASCNVSGTVLWSNGNTTNYKLYLDEIDTMPATNLAYHATAVVWTPNNGNSGRGSLTRRYGKFN